MWAKLGSEKNRICFEFFYCSYVRVTRQSFWQVFMFLHYSLTSWAVFYETLISEATPVIDGCFVLRGQEKYDIGISCLCFTLVPLPLSLVPRRTQALAGLYLASCGLN